MLYRENIQMKQHTLAYKLEHFQQNQANKNKLQHHYFLYIDYLDRMVMDGKD